MKWQFIPPLNSSIRRYLEISYVPEHAWFVTYNNTLLRGIKCKIIHDSDTNTLDQWNTIRKLIENLSPFHQKTAKDFRTFKTKKKRKRKESVKRKSFNIKPGFALTFCYSCSQRHLTFDFQNLFLSTWWSKFKNTEEISFQKLH